MLESMPDVLTLGQLCAVLGISKRTWQNWQRASVTPVPELLPATHHPRFSKRMVEKYLERGRQVLR
jgi:hypothetical protein